MRLLSGRINLGGLFGILAVIWCGIVSVPGQEPPAPEKMGWQMQSSGVISRLSSVFFIDRQRGWIAGSNGTLLLTEDGGLKWRRLSLPDHQKRELVRDAWFFDAERGCLLGEYGTVSRRTPQATGPRVFLLLNGNTGWTEGRPARLPVEKTEKVADKPADKPAPDAGRSPDPLLLRISFVNPQLGWACGESGMIQATEDGGQTWQIQATPTRKLLYDVMGVNEQDAWIVGAGGTILHTSDGGQHWGFRDSGVTEALRAVHFVDSTHGWAVGANGVIIATTDGGDNWRKQDSGASQVLNDLFFVSPKEGWIAGDRGLLLHTRDGGQTWEESQVATNASLTRLFFTAPDCGWVIGSNGAVFKYGPNE
ncbi:MAG TPA: YCF48-related protein [Blastocatellia bacterium]|nr:YCF48-related protein [Blastocatellia bacterium]